VGDEQRLDEKQHVPGEDRRAVRHNRRQDLRIDGAAVKVLASEDVVLQADDDQNQEDGPSGGIEKAIRFHPGNLSFHFKSGANCRPMHLLEQYAEFFAKESPDPFQILGVEFMSLSESLDTATPAGRMSNAPE
jgi:hypothetical protein